MLFNNSKKVVLASSCCIADSFVKRLKGLLGTNSLSPEHALIIKPCFSVHTFGMKYDIDVLFIDHRDRVVKVVGGMPPQRCAYCIQSAYAIELLAGTAAAMNTEVGDHIVWQ